MAGLHHDLDQLVRSFVTLDEHHLRPRYHDVAHLHVRDREHAFDHHQRIAVEKPALARFAQILDELRQVARLAGHGLRDPLQPAAGITSGLFRHWGGKDTRSCIRV
jgi:hypothetical protein